MLVDTHCHLDQLEDPESALRDAAALGVSRVVAVSESAASMEAVLELKHRFGESVLAGLGLHPAWVSQHPDRVAAGLEFLAAHLSAGDVLGEVGLDHRWAETPQQHRFQEEVLERQLSLAAACRKPVNLHSRRCPRQVMDRAIAYRRQTGLNAQLHWFTHSLRLVARCNDEGVFVSVGPIALTDPQARKVASAITDSLLLLETDAPVPVAGQPGHPGRVRAVAETLAQLKGCGWEEIAALTSGNFDRYLAGS
jgi:TatD DNase family protein